MSEKDRKMDLTGGPFLASWLMNIIEFKLRNDMSSIAGRFCCSIKEAGDKIKALVDKIVSDEQPSNLMIVKKEEEKR